MIVPTDSSPALRMRTGQGVRTHLAVTRGIAPSAGSRPPHRVRERLLFGRLRLVRDGSAPEVVRELHGACAVPPSSLRRAEHALQRCEVVRRTLYVRLGYFSGIGHWGGPAGRSL